MKRCTKCGEDKPLDNFPFDSKIKKDGTRSLRSHCKTCENKRKWESIKNNPERREKVRERDSIRGKLYRDRKNSEGNGKSYRKDEQRLRHVKRVYGLSKEQYEQMCMDCNDRCTICKKESISLCVDHCHTTGKVRGLICVQCNTGLACFKDNPSFLESAIEYLKK